MSSSHINDIHNNQIVNIYQTDKRLNCEDSSSESSQSEPDVKRKKTLNYFHGKRIKSWEPVTALIVDDLDITEILKKFRDKNIRIAEASNHLSSVRLLSVSHIFPVSKLSQDNCLTNYMKSEIDIALKQFAYKDLCLSKVSAKSLIYVKDILN
ncbi:hypothetical protein CU097_005302, partial [Rhizopus azygosporus]